MVLMFRKNIKHFIAVWHAAATDWNNLLCRRHAETMQSMAACLSPEANHLKSLHATGRAG
jgi:hypothetical protein